MIVLAVDPGTTHSGHVLFDGARVLDSGVLRNAELLERIHTIGAYVAAELHQPVALAIERFEARGMPIGDESIQTVIWSGRFQQAWHTPDEVMLVKRSAVKLGLCGTNRAKDSSIRQALLDMLGAQGTKRSPGPTYGVASHAWAALAVAVIAIGADADRKSTRLNSSHQKISYAVFCLK